MKEDPSKSARANVLAGSRPWLSLALGKEGIRLPLLEKSLCTMSAKKEEFFRAAGGDAYCWAEQESSVMLKAVTKSGDPVELSSEEAIELAHALLKAAKAVT